MVLFVTFLKIFVFFLFAWLFISNFILPLRYGNDNNKTPKVMIHIFANSNDLLNASPNYANIARGKASKAKRQRMQAKKASIENTIINSIDNKASYLQLKQRRQNAAEKRAKIAAKRLTAAQRVKIA